MKNRNRTLIFFLLVLFGSQNSALAFDRIETEIQNAHKSFIVDMGNPFAKVGFEYLHTKYNRFKIDYTKKKYKNPMIYQMEFNKFFEKEFWPLMWDSRLIVMSKEWYRIAKGKEIIKSFNYNKSEYMQFLRNLRSKDVIFNQMTNEDILKIQIYSNFVISSGGPQKFEYAKRKSFMWPFCRKK